MEMTQLTQAARPILLEKWYTIKNLIMDLVIGSNFFKNELCPNLYTQFSRKQAQNARFHLIENERFGWFSRKHGL